VQIAASQDGARYTRAGVAWKKLSVLSPAASASAVDDNAPETGLTITKSLPVISKQQAMRWAAGLLTHHNREAEELRLDTVFDPAMTALIRLDVTGGTDADGEWLVEFAEHDLIDKTTVTRLRRCLNGIRSLES
jgi:hypothetical protein